MTPRQLDLAAEFCERVGATNLLEYLGVSADTDAEAARAALKARRRKMQGMQANPKYADEARLLIKHFQTLDAVLANPTLQIRDMAKRMEAKSLPALEMSIKTALAGGPLSSEQTLYLRSSARELGVSDEAYDRLLNRLERADAGGDPATAPTAPSPTTARTRPPNLRRDLADVASKVISTTAQPVKPRSRSHSSSRSSSSASDKNVPYLRKPSKSLDAVAIHDPLQPGALSEAATAPPVRTRSAAPNPNRSSQITEPRPMGRDALPKRSSSVEILGDANRDIVVSGRPALLELHVRLLGDLPIAARVSTDDEWLIAGPQRLAPESREHIVQVKVDPRKMHKDTDVGAVLIYNDIGDRVGVTIRATRRFNWYPYLLTSAILTTTVAVAALVVVAVQTFGPAWFPSEANSLTIRVDPSSETVLLDGQYVGRGPAVRVERPTAGKHEINVLHHNFEDKSLEVELAPDEDRILPVRLELSGPLNYKPQADAREHLLPEDPEKRRALEQQFQPCVAMTPRGHRPYRGRVSIYLGPDGQVLGVHFTNQSPIPASVATCLKRQAATVRYPRLQDGDYAVINAEFSYP